MFHYQEPLHPYVDRELDSRGRTKVDEHLERCCECRKAFDEQSSLRSVISKHATYYKASPELAARVKEKIDARSSKTIAPAAQRRWTRPEWHRWLQLGVAVAASVVVTTMATLHLNTPNADEAVAAQVVNGHARSVLTGHQMDVASSDQHTVKPWLSSKLDFSPPVIDLTTTGFPLRGGRLDYVQDRPIAVLIYTHRQHVVDLYIWPSASSPAA